MNITLFKVSIWAEWMSYTETGRILRMAAANQFVNLLD